MKAAVAGFAFASLLVLVLCAGSASRARASSSATSSPVDVEIAFDGTGSMADAIARAQKQAVELTTRAKALLPDTHFAVVAFRDKHASLGEYQLLQPFTSDTHKVKTAIDHVQAKSHAGPAGPESYNLAFHNSYSDSKMGWRPSARKIVVVLGDAQPYGGTGGNGLPGCTDRTKDPDGLSTPVELAHMRAAERTLIMVRMHSSKLTVSLQCYRSIAAAAFVGGAAREEGNDLAAIIVELIEHAYAPVTLAPDIGLALLNGRAAYTFALHNPNVLPVTSSSMSLVLPAGFRYVPGSTTGATTDDPTQSGRTLLWSFSHAVAAHGIARLHIVVRAARRLGSYRSSAVAHIQTAGGQALTSGAPGSVLRVKRSLRALTFRFSGNGANGRSVQGSAVARFAHKVRVLPAGARAHGTVVVVRGQTRLVLRLSRLRLLQFAAPARARLTLRVTRARGLRGCAIGRSGSLLVIRSGALTAAGRTGDRIVLTLPRACGRGALETTAMAVSAS